MTDINKNIHKEDISKNNYKSKTDGEAHFHLLPNLPIRLATIVTIIFGIITANYYIQRHFFVEPMYDSKNKAEKLTEEYKMKNNELSERLNILENELRQFKNKQNIPLIISPSKNASIIGNRVNFKWAYKDVDKSDFEYVLLELLSVQDDSGQRFTTTETAYEDKINSRIYQVPNPDGRDELSFTFPENIKKGQFFWRIKQVRKERDVENPIKELETNNIGLNRVSESWSSYESFRIYPTIIERIKDAKQIIVGTAPTFLSYDHPVGCSGRSSNFDMDLVDIINICLHNKLSGKDKPYKCGQDTFNKMNTKNRDKYELKIKYYEWGELFDKLLNGEVDFVIANITISENRTIKFPGLLFSKGYRDNQQILFYDKNTNTNHKDIKTLEGKTIGVQEKTINAKAAHHLASEYNINIKDIYKYPFDVYEAVEKGEIDFGMVDSVRYESVKQNNFEKVDANLNKALKTFYNNELGEQFDIEEYGIGLKADTGMDSSLKQYLDEIINELDKNGVLEQIKQKHSQPSMEALNSLNCSRD